MKRCLIAIACLVFTISGGVSAVAQNADEPASKDDVILYLRTMHSHDMFRQVMEIQVQNMEQLMRERLKEKGIAPAEFDAHFKKAMDDMLKEMPIDEITEATIPTYQKYFTKSDLAAMNAFYASAVGQKVLQELPVVMQEGSRAAMPIVSKYLDGWKERVEREVKEMEKTAPKADPQAPKQ